MVMGMHKTFIVALTRHILSLTTRPSFKVYLELPRDYESYKQELINFVSSIHADPILEIKDEKVDIAILINTSSRALNRSISKVQPGLNGLLILIGEIMHEIKAEAVNCISELRLKELTKGNEVFVFIGASPNWRGAENSELAIKTFFQCVDALEKIAKESLSMRNNSIENLQKEHLEKLYINEIRQLQLQLIELRKEIDAIYNTKTFRMTEKLRKYYSKLRRIFKL